MTHKYKDMYNYMRILRKESEESAGKDTIRSQRRITIVAITFSEKNDPIVLLGRVRTCKHFDFKLEYQNYDREHISLAFSYPGMVICYDRHWQLINWEMTFMFYFSES